jgi:hypothetical protein
VKRNTLHRRLEKDKAKSSSSSSTVHSARTHRPRERERKKEKKERKKRKKERKKEGQRRAEVQQPLATSSRSSGWRRRRSDLTTWRKTLCARQLVLQLIDRWE